MIEIGDNKNQHDNPLNYDYLSNELYNNFSDELEQSDRKNKIFDIDFFLRNANKFNLAVNENNYQLIIETVNLLIRQLEYELQIKSDPELGDETIFNYLQFYYNCIRCLNLNNDYLSSKIMHTIGLLAGISSSISDTLIINDTLKILIDHFMSRIISASTNDILIFLKFIQNVSLASSDVRYFLIISGILSFFSQVLESQRNFQIYISDLTCIIYFFTYEDFSDDSDIPKLDRLLYDLYQIFVSILNGQFNINFDFESQIIICSYILSIFNTYIKGDRFCNECVKECSHFLELNIPYSLQSILGAELPKDIKNVIAYPIVSIINQLLLFGDQVLVENFAITLNICLFVDLCELEISGICAKCFSIIESLINICSNNISILFQIEFYDKILKMIDYANFDVKLQIVSIFLVTIFNATSTEICQFFANEDIVNIFLDYIDVPKFSKSLFIPDALLKINDLIPQDDPLSFEILQVLDDMQYSLKSEMNY